MILTEYRTGCSFAGVAMVILVQALGTVMGAPRSEDMLITCPTTKDLNQTKNSFAILPSHDNKNFVLGCDWLAEDPHTPDCISRDDFSLVTFQPDRVVAKGPWDVVHRHGSYNLQLLPPDEDLPITPCLLSSTSSTRSPLTTLTPTSDKPGTAVYVGIVLGACQLLFICTILFVWYCWKRRKGRRTIREETDVGTDKEWRPWGLDGQTEKERERDTLTSPKKSGDGVGRSTAADMEVNKYTVIPLLPYSPKQSGDGVGRGTGADILPSSDNDCHCPNCGVNVYTQRAFDIHMQWCKSRKQIATPQTSQTRRSSSDNDYHCPNCGEKIYIQSSLDAHVIYVCKFRKQIVTPLPSQTSLPSSDKDYHCSSCGLNFDTQGGLEFHLKKPCGSRKQTATPQTSQTRGEAGVEETLSVSTLELDI